MPKNLLIEDTKPKNLLVEDTKPKSMAIDSSTATRSYTVIINANQYMGLPFLLTYSTAGTMTQWSESGFDH